MIKPFTSTFVNSSTSTERQHVLSLFELNSMINAVIKHTMADRYWLAAEISELRVASNGHCYLEFVQKDEMSGSLVAKARGNIWRQNYLSLNARFMRATGQPLVAGIKVLVEVTINFHELYGYSLTVSDIDPTYTLGDIARKRKEIIRQLEEDGVINLNKEIPLPRIIRRIAVISSKTAAGYGDFCNQLEECDYAFQKKLFPAIMQGDKVVQSIIAALDKINKERDNWDVVVIIRGGGATTDLSGFDSYLLCANIAQFPLPILTGIGHERDDTICDLVACKRLKTPTAVAAFLIETRKNETVLFCELVQRLLSIATKRIETEKNELENLSSHIRYTAERNIVLSHHQFDNLSHRYKIATSQYTSKQRNNLTRLIARLQLSSHSYLLKEQGNMEHLQERILYSINNLFTHEHQRQQLIEKSLNFANPKRILSLGYTITLKDGVPISDVSQLKNGDTIITRFENSEVKSEVYS